MADNTRQFTLVGNFTDNITTGLDKVNEKLDGILQKLETYKTKLNNLATPMKELGDSIKTVTDAVNAQQTALRGAGDALKYYSQQQGRANRATKSGGIKLMNAISRNQDRSALAKAREDGARLKNTAQADAIRQKGNAVAAKEYARAEQIRSRIRIPGGGGGGRGGGGGGGSIVGARLVGDFVAADLITTAIKNGFQAGVALMYKPFEYFANAFQERIGDELSDVRTAGGLFSISKRQKNPFIKSFREAELLTQTTNKYLAELAGTLPGPTQEYVQIGKQLADGIGSVVANNEKGAIALANVYAKEAGREEILGTGPQAQQKAFTELTGELTKLTVLAGYGQQQRGPYGLPQIAERLVTDENVSLGQLQRYAAIFRDPLIKGELERGIGEIDKFKKESPERLNAVIQLFRKIVTPELIARYRKTVDGIKEGFFTAFFEPETGLLGLGRKLVGVYATARDEFGRVIKDAKKETLSLYEIIRDIISGFGIPLLEIVQILPQIYEPFKQVGLDLVKLRELAQNFLRTYYGFAEGYKQLAEGFEKAGDKKLAAKLRGSAGARAAIETIANLLADFGALSDLDVSNIAKKLISGDDLGPIIKDLFTGFFSSNLWYSIGSTIGQAAGSFLGTLASLGEGFLGLGTGGAVSPFVEGFDKAKGFDALSRLAIVISEAVVRLMIEVIKALGSAFIKAITSGNLLAAAGLGVVGAGALSPVFGLLGGLGGGGKGGKGGGGIFGPTEATKQLRGKLGTGANLLKQIATESLPHALSFHPGVQKVGKAVAPVARGARAVGKFVPGGAVLGGAVSLATSLATGEKFGTAAAGAIGSVLGATAGSFLGPAGTIIGGIAGDFLGREIANRFDPAAQAQQQAAQKQLEAAAGQKEAAGISDVTGSKVPFAVDSNTLAKLAQLGGYQSDKSVQQLIADTKSRNEALQDVKGLTKVLEDAKVQYAQFYGEGTDKYKEALKPFQDRLAAAETVLKTKQKNLETSLDKVPTAIRKKLVDRLATMSTTQIDAALARAIDRASVTAHLNRRNNRRKKGKNKGDEDTGEGWRRSSFGEGCKVSGGLGNKTAGSVDAFNSIARSKGLSLTSGYRPGSPGWHGVNRARDYSNGYGPTPQMMGFAKYMAENYGAKLKELIYTPLGYSIKNGRKVPPYARAGHYNHVHVAYATGYGMPFATAVEAMRYERAMTPGSVKIGSITGNSAEGFGGTTNVTNNITITQQHGESMEHLASMVALKISNAVNEARASSYYV